jgi:hypothetical protein
MIQTDFDEIIDQGLALPKDIFALLIQLLLLGLNCFC